MTTAATRRSARLEASVSAVLVAVAVAFTLWQLHPGLLFADTTPTGGDLAAHVWGPAYLRDHLLPDLQLSGWSFDWFGGFPAYRFYMVVPALLVVLVDVVAPYAVALKLVAVSGAVALPVAAWALGRLTGAAFPVPPLLAIAGLAFLFDETFTIYGGNLASTLAGEFSFSIALALGVVYLGVFARGVRTNRHVVLAGVLFASTALCHGIVALALLPVGTGVFAVVFTGRGRWRTGALYTAAVVGLGTLLSAFWIVPFVAGRDQLTDMGYPRRPDGPDDSHWQMLFPQPAWIDRLLVGAVIAGAVGSIVRHRRLGIALAAMTALFAAWACLQPAGLLWNARLLPFLYLSRYLLVAIGIVDLASVAAATIASLARRRQPAGTRVAVAIAGSVAVLMLLLLQLQELPGGRTTHGVSVDAGVVHPRSTYRWGPIAYSWDSDSQPGYVDDWAAWDFGGLEAAPRYREYSALVATMERLGRTRGCGRALWEDHAELAEYGSANALMLLPYWTDGCIATMDGLFVESSPATTPIALATAALSAHSADPITDLPYEHADIGSGVEQARLLGVHYYLAYTPEMTALAERHPELTEVATSGQWRVYEIENGGDLVVPLAAEPAVAPTAPWLRATPVFISDVIIGDESLSFQVDRVGTAVLVKIPASPGWKASGADGPFSIGSSMVVVPTERHVQLRHQRQPVDYISSTLTGVGVAVTATALVPRRCMRRQRITRREATYVGPTWPAHVAHETTEQQPHGEEDNEQQPTAGRSQGGSVRIGHSPETTA